MKKKMIISFMNIVSMVCCVFGLVGCVGGSENNDIGNISTIVTEEEWNTAFDVKNFLKSAEIVYTQNVSNVYIIEHTLLLSGKECSSYSNVETIFDFGENVREHISIKIVQDEYEDNYVKDSAGPWTYYKVDTYDYFADNYKYWKENVLGFIKYEHLAKIAEKYANFNYKDGKYIYNGNEEIFLGLETGKTEYSTEYIISYFAKNVTITMTDNKLMSISMNCIIKEDLSQDESGENRITYYDYAIEYSFVYGEQIIEAPEGVKKTQE